MDQVRDELRRFERDLDRFNGTMTAAVGALRRAHDQVSPLWQDSFRKEYDRKWAEFGQHMDDYLGREASAYSSFVRSRITLITRYLDG